MIFFHHFWPLSRKSVAFSRKTLAMLLYLCFTSPKRYFDENFFFIEKLFSRTLLDKGKFIPVFWQKLFDNVVKTAFSVSIGIFWGIKSSKKNFFFQSFSDRQPKKLAARGEVLFGKVVKTAIYVSKEIVWGDFFLPKKRKFFECFVTMSEKPSASGKNFFFAAGMSKLQSKFL